jgi:LysR family transcriptional regulator, nitrogen assimilation regulatory protein
MEFRQLRYFVTLFEEGSVTKAARRLGVVQPALSMQIRKLEEEFQTQLFVRTSRGVDPTFAGRNFYKRAAEILDNVRSAETYLRDSSGQVAGDLAVGLMPSLAIGALAPALLEFSNTYPSIKLRVIEAYSDYLIDSLEKNAVDFAIINNDGNAGDAELEPLYEDRLVLVTGQGWSQTGKRIAPEELSCPNLVLPTIRQGMRRTLDHQLAQMGLEITPVIEIDSLNAVTNLVSLGRFATVLPSLAVRELAAGGNLCVHRIEPELKHKVVIAYNQQHPPGLAARAFIDVLKSIVMPMIGEEVAETGFVVKPRGLALALTS